MVEETIKIHLRALERSIAEGAGDAVAGAISDLDEIVSKNRRTLHPQLMHFLERRSYNKALAFLGGTEEIPKGSCGKRAHE